MRELGVSTHPDYKITFMLGEPAGREGGAWPPRSCSTATRLRGDQPCNPKAPPLPNLPASLDHLAMITVQHPKYGLFDCKRESLPSFSPLLSHSFPLPFLLLPAHNPVPP